MNAIFEKIIEIIKQIIEMLFNKPDVNEPNFITLDGKNFITLDDETFFVKEV